jgi:ATP-binding cassette subfamily B protein
LSIETDKVTPNGRPGGIHLVKGKSLVAGFLQKEEQISHITTVDMDTEGKYALGWIVLTDRRLFTYYEGDLSPRLDIPLTEIYGVTVDHYVGNGIVELELPDKTVLLCRFSRTLALDMEDFNDEIEKFININGQSVENEEEKFRRLSHRNALRKELDKRCPKCGHILHRSVCPNCIQKKAMMKRLFGYMRPYWFQLIIIIVLMMGGAALRVMPPVLQGRLVDHVTYNGDLYTLFSLVAMLGTVLVGTAIIEAVRGYYMAIVAQGVVKDLRSEVFHHLQYLRLQFYDTVRTGAIMSRATNDTEHVHRFVVQSVQVLVYELFIMVFIAYRMFGYSWKLALATMVPIPLVVIATKVFAKKVRKIYRRIWVRRALMNSVLADAIPGIQVVKSFAQEKREINKFDKRNEQVFLRQIDAARYRSVYSPVLSFSTALGTLLIWGYGGYLALVEKSLSVGDLVAFFYLLNQFYNPVLQISNFSDVIQEAATASERIFEILDTEPEIKAEVVKEKPIALEQMRGGIEFRDVYFSYSASEPVLEGINVKIKPGEMIGLVGPSGSGKTTIVNLIPRLYDVTTGQLLIDGHDIRTLDLKTLRKNIGVVLQEPLLFHGTIADNIAYGVPNASREEIIYAAQAANAHNFIMGFADGYDTHTGERGLRLSGGQKQRISIARAILKNPRILILDEATSSVDTETEKLIQEAIERLIENRTTIAIAHRLSTLRNADRLLVMDHGRIVEEGTHEQLMAQDGVFARLVRMQTEMAQTRIV